MSTNYISQITATNGTTYDISSGMTSRIFRATCSTAAATAAKVATLDDSTGYSLAAGVCVAVTFTYGNSAATPTLNVNSGGAKNIVYPSAVTTNETSNPGSRNSVWGAYETVLFTYNGTYWIIGKTSLAASHIWNGTGTNSVVEGDANNAASGSYSHAEGYGADIGVTAFGIGSHAEGGDTQATGNYSHAEGYLTIASNQAAHSEGESTTASSVGSHAEGEGTIANGAYSHAGGQYTTAQGKSQTVIGTYNILDSATTTTHQSDDSNYRNYAFIIGNGTDGNSRSNALTVDWTGKLTVEGHSSPIGDVKTAAWTASSSASSGTALTDTITLTPGVWLIVVSLPGVSRTHQYYLSNISSSTSKYYSAVSQGTFSCIYQATSTISTSVMSAASTSTTYSTINRGHLEAVRIA